MVIDLYRTLEFHFRSPEHAEIAKKAISVDEELQKNSITRTVSTNGSTVVVHFVSKDDRVMRVALSSVIDMMGVVTRTLRDFAE